ncbi:hypothetical protein [Streptomyces sp. NPDC020965]|uniref:hypothetical protein n=1 Tax=Streptomyces sp. NPDC020965 TaxID=3365105 RepID=UPI0037B67714
MADLIWGELSLQDAPPPRIPRSRLNSEQHFTTMLYPVIIRNGEDIDLLLETMRCNIRNIAHYRLVAHMALIDFADCPASVAVRDQELRAKVEEGIRELHGEYPDLSVSALFRRRKYNAADRMWMGWERKRGKLIEFCGLCVGDSSTTFDLDTKLAIEARYIALKTRFAITLDVGGEFRGESAMALIEVMAHPANHPVIDRKSLKVVSGFTFLRPAHVSIPPRSIFELLSRGPRGAIERPPSLMQKIAGHDQFYGKGIIDVVAAWAILKPQIPENRVLSHDTLEGALAGVAVVHDSQLVDPGPWNYLAFRSRNHRWSRGDFQLVPWLFGPRRASIGIFSRWLLLVAYSRAIYQLVGSCLIILAWLSLPVELQGGAMCVLFGCYFAKSAGFVPISMTLSHLRAPNRNEVKLCDFLRSMFGNVGWKVLAQLTWLTLMADQAIMTADAWVRANFRLITGRKALEWLPDAKVPISHGRMPNPWRWMWAGPMLSVCIGVLIYVINSAAMPFGLPFLFIWFISPYLVRVYNLPLRRSLHS